MVQKLAMPGARSRRLSLRYGDCSEVSLLVSASTKPSMTCGCASRDEREFCDVRPPSGGSV